MATLSVQTLTGKGKVIPSFANAAGGGDVAPNAGGGITIVVRNGDASAKTVTFKSFAETALEGTAVADKAFSIPAGGLLIFGPLDVKPWNNGSNQVEITYSAVTSVTVAVIKGA
ncbi:MAG: hypothetical protein RJA36_1441 [Pseudomonadota bacterium]|jgi:hypothetical protein